LAGRLRIRIQSSWSEAVGLQSCWLVRRDWLGRVGNNTAQLALDEITADDVCAMQGKVWIERRMIRYMNQVFWDSRE